VTPPGLLGAALVFWGWQTGFVAVGVVMGALLEARHVLASRWALSRADFNRVSDFSAVLLVVVAIYEFVSTGTAHAVLAILEWLPLTLLPLVACQVYSTTGTVDRAIFFWSARRRASARPEDLGPRVDLTYPYVAMTVCAAGAASVRSGSYFLGVGVIAAWALWPVRSRRYPAAIWAATLALAVALGWAGHVAIAAAQQAAERVAQGWLLDWFSRETDPFQSSTALGEIGEIKLSPRIVVRVESPVGVPPPPLLRAAAYNVYNAPVWYAVDAPFTPIQPIGDAATWRVGPSAPERGRAIVSAYLPRGRGLLPAPTGVRQLEDLLVVRLAKNPLGALRVDEGIGLVRYAARFSDGPADAPPRSLDLVIPRSEQAALERAAAELELAGKRPAQAALAIRAWFGNSFRYSRFVRARRKDASALEDFFFRTRAGHCEYFATGTVLLLRAAGIPARYAIGYAVHEWSPFERRYVVRASDAHAWTLAWLGGAWREIDTTPPEWVAAEREAETSGTLGDLWSWAAYAFSAWRWREPEDRLPGSIGWLLVPLLLFIGWRVYRRRRRPSVPAPTAATPPTWHPGDDSPFYEVEQRLSRLAFPRAPGEPLTRWLARVDAAQPSAVTTARLPALLELHYRYRFDPEGLDAGERETLERDSHTWLSSHPAASSDRN
jgi:transglutaminase-like putative cysteine protease